MYKIHRPALPRGFLFFYFLFSFFTKIYVRVRNLHEYTPAAPLPGGRGLSAKKIDKKLRRGLWRTGRPAAGRPALQAARQRGGGPWPPACGATGPPTLYKVLAAPHPLICLTKNPEKKERERGRGGVRERQSGEALPDFQAGDCR